MEILIAKIKSELSEGVGRYKSSDLLKEKDFLLSKLNNFTVPHFYITWKFLKNPIVGKPIGTGYNWILTPASIFVGHYLKEFSSKFDSSLTDSSIAKNCRFQEGCFFIYDRS